MSRATIANLVAGGCVLVALTGCGHANTPETSSRTTVRPTVTTSRRAAVTSTTVHDPSADIAAATAAYDRWADLVLDMTRPDADWSQVDLRDYLAGPLLAHIEKVHADRANSGEVLRRPVPSVADHRVTHVTIHGDTAELETCEVNDGIVESKDGVILNDLVSTYKGTVIARRLDGGWRLWETRSIEKQSGAHPC